MIYVLFFFFKQKTAYEMRISDWSSDVCSSDLQAHGLLDALTLIDISNNIGDARSLMTHPASTTHAGVSEDVRHDMGVSEGMLRLNVGLEDVRDLIDDLDQALRQEIGRAHV